MKPPTLLDLAKIQLVIDAYKIYDNQEDVSKHIGISSRALRYWLTRYSQLKKYQRLEVTPSLEEILKDDKYD